MFFHILCRHDKLVFVAVSNGSHDIAGSDIQSKDQGDSIHLLVKLVQLPFFLNRLCDLIKGLFLGSIIVDYHLAIPTVFAIGKLASKYLVRLFSRITSSLHHSLSADFLCGINIPELVANFLVIVLNKQGGLNNDKIHDADFFLLCNLA